MESDLFPATSAHLYTWSRGESETHCTTGFLVAKIAAGSCHGMKSRRECARCVLSGITTCGTNVIFATLRSFVHQIPHEVSHAGIVIDLIQKQTCAWVLCLAPDDAQGTVARCETALNNE